MVGQVCVGFGELVVLSFRLFVCLPVSWVVLAVCAPMMTAKIKVAIFESSEAKKV